MDDGRAGAFLREEVMSVASGQEGRILLTARGQPVMMKVTAHQGSVQLPLFCPLVQW